MNTRFENSIVRFFTLQGRVVAAGFLVAEMTIITCAHVVAAALDLKEYSSELPTAAVSLDFPLITSEHKFSAQVIFWQPPQVNGGGDIAVLRLNSQPPASAQSARLVVTDDLWGHDFRAFGFPDYHDNGVWASGKLLAVEATGWVLIEDVKETGYRVQPGFSGGAVWDEQLDGVTGIVVAAENDSTIKAAYMIPANVLIEAYPQLGQQAIPPCPYRGLFAFREQDEKYFFGREVFIKQMVDAIHRNPLLAVVGPSGSGKSSVVFAGLLPHLRKEGGWLITSLRPGNHPFHSLAAGIVPLLEPSKSGVDVLTEVGKLTREFQEENISLRHVVETIIGKNDDLRLLLVIDQFEEIYTLCHESEMRQHFLDELFVAVQSVTRSGITSAPRFTLVLTLRADFIGQALSYRQFADMLQHADLKLGPMNREELLEAMREPAAKLRVAMEQGLSERILNDVHEPNQLPLLEFALTLLWDEQQNNILTHAAYEEIGGVEQALADHAEAVYNGLDARDQLRTQQVFVRLVRPGEGTEDTRRIATRSEIGEDNWELVMRLVNARLLVSDRDETMREETVEVVHEALIQRWERLQNWVNADRNFLAWNERLRAALRQWQESNRDDGVLLRGTPLVEAKVWLEKRSPELNAREKDYLFQSILNEGVGIEKWLPKYWKIEEVFAVLDANTDSEDESKRLRDIVALRWAPYSEQEDEVSYRLQRLVTTDMSPAVRMKAAQSLCERGHARDLTKLLTSKNLSKEDRKRLIDALASVRNVPETGRELEVALQHSKRRILFTAMWKVILAYRNQFLIFLLLLLILTGIQLINETSSAKSNIRIDIQVIISNIIFTIAILMISLYLINRKLIDNERIELIKCFIIALSFSFIANSIQVFYSSILDPKNVPIKDVLTFKFVTFISSSGFFSDALWILVLALFMRLSFNDRSLFWKVLEISILSAVAQMLAEWIVSIILFLQRTQIFSSTKMSYDLAMLLVSVNTYRLDTLFATAIINMIIAFMCLVGFLFSFRSAFTYEIDLSQVLIPKRTAQLPLTNASSTDLHTLARNTSASQTLQADILSSSSVKKLKANNPSELLKRGFFLFVLFVLIYFVGVIIPRGIILRQTLVQPLTSYPSYSIKTQSVSLSPDKQRIGSIDEDGKVLIWDNSLGKMFTLGSKGRDDIEWSHDGRFVAFIDTSNIVWVWDATSKKMFRSYHDPLNEIRSIVWSPDYQQVALGSQGNTVRVWNVSSGKLLSTYHGNGTNEGIVWSPDGTRLAAIFGDGSAGPVEVWNTTSGKMLYTSHGHFDSASRVVWSPDNKRLAIVVPNNTIQVWNASSGKMLYIYHGKVKVTTVPFFSSNYSSYVTWSPDNKYLAGTFHFPDGDDHVEIWDAASGKVLVFYRGHAGIISALVWSPDGRHIVSIGYDNTVQVWDATTGDPVYACYNFSLPLKVAWSTDELQIFSLSLDGIVQVWRIS